MTTVTVMIMICDGNYHCDLKYGLVGFHSKLFRVPSEKEKERERLEDLRRENRDLRLDCCSYEEAIPGEDKVRDVRDDDWIGCEEPRPPNPRTVPLFHTVKLR